MTAEGPFLRRTGSAARRCRRAAAGSLLFLVTLIVSCPPSGGPVPGVAAELPPPMKFPEYQASSTCRACHDRIFDEFVESLHARAFVDPVFQSQYRVALLPRLAAETALAAEADRCVACHSPVAYLKAKGRPGPLHDPAADGLAGVICDLCHRIGAYKGRRVGGGNYMSAPGDKKFGPFKNRTSDWHHVYHELQVKSELCGICHEDANRAGLPVQTTFSEWKASGYAQRGVQCQDCHMSPQGFLTAGRRVQKSGKAATMTVGKARERDTLSTHRFPGAHVAAQVEGAAAISIDFDRPAAVAGQELVVRLTVTNRRAGHAIPTGTTELRLVWLELAAETGGVIAALPAPPAAPAPGYDVAGRSPADAAILGADVPPGSRLYRAVFVDAAGKQTLSSWDAAAVAFDNRLGAEESREERYSFRVPAGAAGRVTFRAKLFYRRYPASFAVELGLAAAAPFVIAAAEASLPLAPGAPAPPPSGP